MNRLLEIGHELQELIRRRSGLGLVEWQLEKDLAAQRFKLLPAEGWPGKNQEQREQARDLAYAGDAQLQEIQAKLDGNHVELAVVEGRMAGLEVERRALEWAIRGTLANALAGKRDSHAPVEEAGFDEAAAEASWQALYETAPAEGMRLTDEDGHSATDDDLPF